MTDSNNHVDEENLFVPLLFKQSIKRLFEECDIGLSERNTFLKVLSEFHEASFIYAAKSFPSFDDLLKNV